MMVWLSLWTLGGVGAFFSLVSMLFGKWMITCDHRELQIMHTVVMTLSSKKYDTSHVSDIRWGTVKSGIFDPTRLFTTSREPIDGLLFEYGPKTISFGMGVDKGEGNAITAMLHRYIRRRDQ